MPYLETAQEWLTQSSLLLQARPTTTRVTTKYKVDLDSGKVKNAARQSQISDPAITTAVLTSTTRATLTLKTYDPASGTTLKYKTDKAAEVGRLVLSLSRLGRTMSGLPDTAEDTVMGGLDAPIENAEAVSSGVATPLLDVAGAKPTTQGASQGGKKGKKKGKR